MRKTAQSAQDAPDTAPGCPDSLSAENPAVADRQTRDGAITCGGSTTRWPLTVAERSAVAAGWPWGVCVRCLRPGPVEPGEQKRCPVCTGMTNENGE